MKNRLTMKSAFLFGAVLMLPLSVSVPAHAQWAVYDGAAHVQTVLIAARELQQVSQQAQSLLNEATMLENQARNLANLPLSVLAPLEQSIQQTEQIVGQAQGLSYNLTSIDQAFTQTYPQALGSPTSAAQMAADAQTRWQNARDAYQDGLRVQTGAVQNLDATRSQIDSLVTSSQAASGALQAAQSGNQLTALQTRQLADLTAVVTAMGRAQALDGARQVESEEQGRAQLANFLNYGAGYTPGTAQMFH
ncbi:P-type conjugative transfer protein TrbJ [Gluconacetobacter sp. 1c LMG 22058]|uniref:P-type conjugative transfer protein TrbJ n=1 Tax=Gluconacetobacter dulcium TaxID=2729096 RepID=A0A7W4K209_9PROT|nr:P-type conjugative transfer protein TrbJ [Gluconacetobacter dulcium]MBB2198737.1 P-type conjugative transfer protein TrbJ [Gluconacetobacter dulcium]